MLVDINNKTIQRGLKMAKNYKKYNVTKLIGFYEKDGEEKKKHRQVGEIVVFSDSPIPEDLNIMTEMYDQCNHLGGLKSSNPLSTFPAEKRS